MTIFFHSVCLVFLERTSRPDEILRNLAAEISCLFFLENQVESAVFLGASLSNSHLSVGMKQSYLNLQICSIRGSFTNYVDKFLAFFDHLSLLR